MIIQIYFITSIPLLLLLLLIHSIVGTPPAGYQKKSEEPNNKNVPKYEYAYKIENGKGIQGKVETRDGIYALGRYFVQGNDAAQNVRYFADDWGFHPYVEYSNVGSHSRSRAHIAIGAEAVKSYQKQNQDVEPAQLKAQFDNLDENVNGKEGTLIISPVKTLDKENQDQFATQTPNDDSKSYIVPEQATQQQIAPIPIIIMQQQEQINNVINSNNQPNNYEQQNNQEKESAIYYVPIHAVLQNDYYSNNNQLPTAQTILQLPIQSAQINQQLELGQNNVVVQQEQKLDDGTAPKTETHEIAESGVNKNNNEVNGELVEAREQFVQTLNNKDEQNINVNNQQVLLTNNQVEQQLINLQNQQQILAIQNNQQQIATVSNDEQKDTTQLYYIPTDQPLALPYVYLNQYTDADKLTTNLQESTNEQQILNENKEFESKEEFEELPRIKQLLNAEKFANEEVIKQTTLEPLEHEKKDKSNAAGITQQQEYTFVQEETYQTTSAPPQLQQTVEYHNVAQTNSNYGQQEIAVNTFDFTAQSNTGTGQEKDNFDAIYALEQLGGYGTKLNAQEDANLQNKPSRLIDSTKNMVNGFDVLNINAIQYAETESSTPNSITADYVSLPLNTFTSIESAQNLAEDKVKLNSQQHFSTTPPTTTYVNTNEIVNLSEQPIVVADVNNDEQSLNVFVSSTTEASINTVSENEKSVHLENTVLVTPRPVSTQFLAPITAGVQLQSLEYLPNAKENVYVEIQRSVPYYLGKVEYVQGDGKSSDKTSVNKNAFDNLKDGNTLITYKENAMKEEMEQVDVKKHFHENNLNENCTETKESQKQSTHHSSTVQQGLKHKLPLIQIQGGLKHEAISQDLSMYDKIEASQELPLPQFLTTENKFTTEQFNQQLSLQQITKIEKDIIAAVANKEMTEANNNHYYIAIPNNKKSTYKGTNQISEQHVQIPVPVLEPNTKIHTQIIEKPVHITKYVDRPYPVPVQVHVPIPYTVEKKVPVPVTVEKFVDRPVTVTKYIDRPVHVPQPYVVEKLVEKHVEVPVEVTKYVDRPYHIQVPVPQPVPYPVEVALPPSIPNDKPYVNKNHNNKIEKPRPSPGKIPSYDLHRPNNGDYGIPLTHYTHQPIQVDVPKYIDKIVNKPIPVYYLSDNKVQQTTYPSQYLYAPNYHPNIKCDQDGSHSANFYHTINPDDYIGLTPPKPIPSRNLRLEDGRIRQNRHARHEFGKNLRIEYGFMPPLIPSLEIDENGQPVEKNN